MQRDALGSLDAASLNGMNQTSKLTMNKPDEDYDGKHSSTTKGSLFRSTGFSQSKVSNVSDLFYKSHISGFDGIKKKYAEKVTKDYKDEMNNSYTTNFYRTQNTNFLNTARASQKSQKEEGFKHAQFDLQQESQGSEADQNEYIKIEHTHTSKLPVSLPGFDVSKAENLNKYQEQKLGNSYVRNYMTNDINIKGMLKKYR